MNVLEAIKIANEQRPNAIEEETKARWLTEFDGEIAELMGVDTPACKFPEDQTLLMPYPKDELYVLYLNCKIDLVNEESALYGNDSAIFNSYNADARAWWFRNYGSPNAKYVRI